MANNELVMTYLKRLEKHLNGRKVEELPFNDVNLLKCLISKIISDNNDYQANPKQNQNNSYNNNNN